MTSRPRADPGPGGQPPDPAGAQRRQAGAPGQARDRDPAGRPRNARPRDALGRPLPRDAAGEERVPDDLTVPPAEALRLAQRLLDTGRPFHAHEVLEASWKTAPSAERELWRGLAQIAVGLTHARRGNAQGASALLRRGGLRVGEYAGGAPHRIDAGGIARQATGLADRIDADGLAAAACGDAGLHLTVAGS
jgi:uncharacterized protein